MQDSRQLLREENFRKLVSREFPKLSEDLKEVLRTWEEEGGKPLAFDGEPYLVTMGREQENPNFGLLHLKLLTSPQKNREERRPLSTANGAKPGTTPPVKKLQLPGVKSSPPAAAGGVSAAPRSPAPIGAVKSPAASPKPPAKAVPKTSPAAAKPKAAAK